MHVQRGACSAHDEQGASRRCAQRGGVWSSHLERESSGLVEERRRRRRRGRRRRWRGGRRRGRRLRHRKRRRGGALSGALCLTIRDLRLPSPVRPNTSCMANPDVQRATTRDGGSVLTCTYKGGHAQHTMNKQGASRRCAQRGRVWSSHLERESSDLVEERRRRRRRGRRRRWRGGRRRWRRRSGALCLTIRGLRLP